MKLAQSDPQAAKVIQENGHLPENADAPDLLPHEMWVWRCFMRLTHDRPQHPGGMGPPIPGRIPWALLRQWAACEEISDEMFEVLDYCIGEMDLEFMEREAERRKKT